MPDCTLKDLVPLSKIITSQPFGNCIVGKIKRFHASAVFSINRKDIVDLFMQTYRCKWYFPSYTKKGAHCLVPFKDKASLWVEVFHNNAKYDIVLTFQRYLAAVKWRKERDLMTLFCNGGQENVSKEFEISFSSHRIQHGDKIYLLFTRMKLWNGWIEPWYT